MSGSLATMTIAATGVRVQSRIASGSFLTCALDAAGATRCWGSNRLGALGIPAVVGDTTLPVLVPNAPVFSAITSSRANTATGTAVCALTATGAAYCWGMNEQGQLGVAPTDQCPFLPGASPSCTRRPMPVSGGRSFVSIGVGAGPGEHTSRACAATSSGEAYCWGENSDGQLGNGNTMSASAPTLVASDSRFVQLSLGDRFTCGVTASAEIYCWGSNANGGLGDGGGASSLVPIRVASSERFATVAAAYNSACALTIDGRAFCWGTRLGLSVVDRTPTLVAGGHIFTDIDVGGLHACALTREGETWCWGRQSAVGDGLEASTVRDAPVRARSSLVHVAVSTGFHTCALTREADMVCWGNNSWGQLGIGNRENNAVPVRVNISARTPGLPRAITANTATEGSASAGSLTTIGGPQIWRTQVRVTDGQGIAVPGIQTIFTVASGGGSVSEATVTTNAAGTATSVWRLGSSPVPQHLHVTAPSVPDEVAVFSATAVTPGPVTSVTRVGDSQRPVGSTTQVFSFVQLRDANGFVVGGIPMTFSRTGQGGTVVPSLPTTLLSTPDGFAPTITWTADTLAGPDTLWIAIADVVGSPFRIVMTAVHLAASQLSFIQMSQGGSAAVKLSPDVQVAVRDPYGNFVTNASSQISLTLIGGIGTLGGTTSLQAVGGISTFSDLTVSAAGTYQLRAAMGTLTATSASFTITP